MLQTPNLRLTQILKVYQVSGPSGDVWPRLQSSEAQTFAGLLACDGHLRTFANMVKRPRSSLKFGIPGHWWLPGPYQAYAGTRLKTTSIYVNRVQAENEKISPSTFPNGFDPRIDLAPFFFTSSTVFTYHQSLLARLNKKWDKTTITW